MRFLKIVRRVAPAVLAMLAIASCLGDESENLGETTSEVVTTNLTTYVQGQNIVVTYSGLSGATSDWINLALTTAPDTDTTNWKYTGGGTSGTVTYTSPNLPPGTYEARAYHNWIGTKSTVVQQRSAPFTITAAGPSVAPTMTNYATGSTVVINFANLPGNQQDWVSVALAGSPLTSYVAYRYTMGQVNGSRAFAGLPAGNYEARAYVNNTFTLIASATFSVGTIAPPAVTTTASSYNAGQPVVVNYTNMPGNPLDWVSIAQVGTPDTSYVQWVYTNGAVNGQAQFSNLPAGNYEARVYRDNTFTLLARSAPFAVVGGSTCTPPGVTLPVVGGITSGTITMSSSQRVISVPMTPDLATSVLLTTIRENESSPQFGGVMCTLHGQDVDLGPPALTCRRNDPGTDTPGSTGEIVIHWNVVTFTSGVSVQRGEANNTGASPLAVPLSSVNLSSSFILLGGIVNGGAAWGSNEFVRAALTDPTTLTITTAVPGTRVAWQVVTMTGATVRRGIATLTSGQTVQTVQTSAVPTGSMLLATYTTDNATGIAASSIMLQSRLLNGSSIDFRRAEGGSNINVAWEIVSLPFATFDRVANFNAGQSSTSVAVPNITPSTSVALSTTQSLLGPSTGSTTFNTAFFDVPGETSFTLETGTGNVTLTRAATGGSATLPFTVIDFSKDCAGN